MTHIQKQVSLYNQVENTRYALQIGAIIVGICGLYLASFIEIPLVPVPITLQSFMVTCIGAFYGARLGFITVVLWLVCAALGLPLLAGGKFGLAPFFGVTAGYLFAFPFAAFITGVLAKQGFNGHHFSLCFINMLIGNLFCLCLGALWLASQKGAMIAFTHGFMPFLLGLLIKSIAAAICLKILAKIFFRHNAAAVAGKM